MTLVTFDSDALTVRPWEDPVVDRVGFDPRSPYVERFWLGVIGPSTTWLLRRIAAGFDASPEGFAMPLGETARALGLGDRSGRNSPFFRTINRMLQFELAMVTHPDEIAVRRRLPALGPRYIPRLSPALQEAHQQWLAEARREPPAEAQRRRSRQLALSLLELGEDAEEVERQLLRWRYHPALARESALWATDRHRRALEVADAG
jgi:hypothetical protein